VAGNHPAKNMTKQQHIKKPSHISPERLAELRRATLIASTGASVRLAGSKVTDKEVERVVNTVFGQK
jgi:hypothetical protein